MKVCPVWRQKEIIGSKGDWGIVLASDGVSFDLLILWILAGIMIEKFLELLVKDSLCTLRKPRCQFISTWLPQL